MSSLMVRNISFLHIILLYIISHDEGCYYVREQSSAYTIDKCFHSVIIGCLTEMFCVYVIYTMISSIFVSFILPSIVLCCTQEKLKATQHYVTKFAAIGCFVVVLLCSAFRCKVFTPN